MRKLYVFSLALSVLALGASAQTAARKFSFPAGITSSDYMPGRVIIKLSDSHRNAIQNDGSVSNPKLAAIVSEVNGSIEKKFPKAKAPSADEKRKNPRLADITRIFELTYSTPVELSHVINRLTATGILDYAEPHYLPKLDYAPNDPSGTATGQYHLNKIKAFQAWDVTKGDTTVVIGITDSGTEVNHPDLRNNVKKNYADPIDGVDNDNDGYTDNFRGWDLGQNDNNPQYAVDPHGVHVSGIAAASTDNATGIAGVGFKCKFIPVKIADGTGALTMAYEGIVYAADQGCKVINCSWGSAGGGQFGQDIIDYATFNRDALVVAASGNDGAELNFFPASYDAVLSVASTNQIDAKSGFSNYGYLIDLCAPGSSIYATYTGTSYTSQSGTSMASPVAAGAAAIIRSMFPTYSALQAGQHLKVTTDNIYGLSSNAGYINKLGTGRINLQRAVTTSTAKSVELIDHSTVDNNDNAFVENDTLRIRCDFMNYLAATTNLTVTLTSTSGNVTVIDGTTSLGALATNTAGNNNADPFTVKINAGTPQNAVIPFKVTFTDGTYTESRFFSEIVNVDYINIDINDVATSITSKGKIGYNQDSQTQGLGFTYLGGLSQLYEASLMIGGSSSAVSDMARGATGGSVDADFQSSLVVSRSNPAVFSDFDVNGEFTDNISSTPVNVETMHSAYAWTDTGARKFVIVEYRIRNTGTTTLANLYAGIFADWDILDYAKNKAGFDATNKMGYIYSTDSSLYMGIKLLTSTASTFHYAIDNITGGGGGMDISAGFATSQKYTSMSSNRATAGGTGTGNDVAHVVASGPFSLPAGDTAVVAFALLAGDDLVQLQGSAQVAQLKYDGLAPTSIKKSVVENTIRVVPNPSTGDVTRVEIALTSSADASVQLYDMAGREIFVVQNLNLVAGVNNVELPTANLSAGSYLIKTSVNGKSTMNRLNISK